MCERRSPNAQQGGHRRGCPAQGQSWKGSAGGAIRRIRRTGGRRIDLAHLAFEALSGPSNLGQLRAARGPVHLLDDEGPADPSAFTTDISADLAELAEVEAELDTRWPETKIEPSLTRISTLMICWAHRSSHIRRSTSRVPNGKTSVTRMIDALLTVALHRRTGRITSPHLQLVTERSRSTARRSHRTYIDTYRELEPTSRWSTTSSTAAGGPRMSKFEVLTAMAYAAFAEAPVDVAVVETGMGGRWDATNVIDSQVRVITPIALDHADYLGDTLAAIAGEKAGSSRRAKGDDFLAQDPGGGDRTRRIPRSPWDVLLLQAVESETIVARQNSEFAVLESRLAVGGQLLTLRWFGRVYEEIFPALHGAHQAANAALALAAVERSFRGRCRASTDIDAVRAGFAAVSSPGRPNGAFGAERLRRRRTTRRATALANALAEEFDFRRLVGVIRRSGTKDAEGLLEALEPVLDHVVVNNNGLPSTRDRDTRRDRARGVRRDRVTVEPFRPTPSRRRSARAEESGGTAGLVRAW